MEPSTMRTVLLTLVLTVGLLARADEPCTVQTVASGLDHPWSLAFLPDGSALLTERPGRLRRLAADGALSDAIAGVPEVYAEGQGGLFEVLLDPGFADNRRLYLSFAHGDRRANATRVVRARLEGHALVEVTPIYTVMPTKSGSAHFGGRMTWLPDGRIALGLGDGFDFRELAQDPDAQLGKIVAFAPDGSRFAILSSGHRNVQGLVYDAARKALYAHEHGPRGGDELNRIEPGRNYGWPLVTHGIDYTGAKISPFQHLDGYVDPLLVWTPSIAPAGLAIYRGAMYPEWNGDLLVAALAARELRRVRLRADGRVEQEVLCKALGERLRDVRVAPDGALWLLTDSAAGRVLRMAQP
jgi:glucose/arabinose dehydrogenase